jgi:hypothetical protein
LLRGIPEGHNVWGVCRHGADELEFCSRHTRRLGDDLLSVLVAHELAHAVLFVRHPSDWLDEGETNLLVSLWGFNMRELLIGAGYAV